MKNRRFGNTAKAAAVYLLLPFVVPAQERTGTSIHQEEWQQHRAKGLTAEDYEALNIPAEMPRRGTTACSLQKMVFGWHPYWSNGLEANYDWSLLTDLSYFSYDVDPATGNPTTTNNWLTAGVVSAAQANGVRVNLCVTLFSSHATFFGSASAQQNLIDNLIWYVQQRSANGVNIDFEAVPSSFKNNLTAFMNNLANQMHAAIPGSQVSMALPAVNWSGTYDAAAMTSVDLFCIMGYDYYWSGSADAGPTDPLYSFSAGYDYHLSRSVNDYLNAGIPASKLLMGVPYYGREWETVSSTIPSATTGNFTSSRTFKVISDDVNGNYAFPSLYDKSMSVNYTYNNGAWRQCFINSRYTMEQRHDLVNRRGLAGIGIWALGYDDSYTDYWDAIREKFTDCGQVACTGTIYDMGGPQGSYRNFESYAYTIAPTNATGLSLSFQSFNVEAGYDYLYIYDGPDTNAPQVAGSPFTGTTLPGTVTATGNALTLRFYSDGGITAAGWEATWSCSQAEVKPTTAVTAAGNWQTADFPAVFSDSAGAGGPIRHRFGQVSDLVDTVQWRANAQNGFFNDDFDGTAIHPEWTSASGTWSISTGNLYQGDEANANTNLYAALAQDASRAYLYEWRMWIGGTGTNRRAGLHFFSDNAALPNRGNSYFVWFRADQNALQFYKVTGDTYTLMKEVPAAIAADAWIFVRTIYDPASGAIGVYLGDTFIGSWTDAAPITAGSAVSFRNGDSRLWVDNFRVYRSRTAAETVTIGSPSADVRYQNPDPSRPSCTIRSIVADTAWNLSSLSQIAVNIDWTAPAAVAVSDGPAADVDTVFSATQWSAGWTASSDSHSGVTRYLRCLGSSPGDSDVVAWTDNGTSLSFTANGLSLTPGQTYYVSVRTENGAGLLSESVSDGAIVDLDTGLDEARENGIAVYPNPFSGQATILFNGLTGRPADVTVYDLSGRMVRHFAGVTSGKLIFDTAGLDAGVYMIGVISGSAAAMHKRIIVK